MVAARMFEDEEETADVVIATDRDEQTVRRWRRQWRARGVEGLRAKRHPGPEPRMGEGDWQKLLTMLAKPPSAYGFAAYLWTAELIGRLVKATFGVGYSHDYVGMMLRRYDWSPQRPAKVAREKDPVAVKQWVDVTWRNIAEDARASDAVIVFVDEAGFSMVPCLKSTWAPAGRTPVVLHRNRWHRKVSVIGAIAVDTRRPQTPTLLSDWHPDTHVTQAEIGSFLNRLLRQFKDRNVVLVWDKLQAHRGSVVREFLAAHPTLTMHYLPSYSPELNPVEQVWALSKYHRMANHAIDDLAELHAEAARQVRRIGRDPDVLCNFIKHTGLGDALYPVRAQ